MLTSLMGLLFFTMLIVYSQVPEKPESGLEQEKTESKEYPGSADEGDHGRDIKESSVDGLRA